MNNSRQIAVITDRSGNIVGADRGRYDLLRKSFLQDQELKGESLKTYRNAITQFFSWILRTGRDISALSQVDIRVFKKNMLDSRHSPLTVNSYLLVIRRFYDWAEAHLAYPNIAKGVRNAAVETGFVKMHLEPAQATALLDYFREAGSVRNYAMVNLMLRGGLRTIEVSRARVGHIRSVMTEKGRRDVLYIHGKKHEDTGSLSSRNFIVLSDKAAAPLSDYLARRGETAPDEPLFPTEGKGHKGRPMSTRNIQNIVKEGLRAIGLDDHQYSAHSLRHTTAVTILKYGNGTFNDVQRVLRHKSLNTSQIYTESIERQMHIENPSELLIDKSF